MTTEEKAKAYAKKELVRTIRGHAHPLDELAPYFDSKDIQQAYEDGATEALASQWKDPNVELPEDDRQVLVETGCGDKELRHAISYFLAGAWHFPDDWYYDCRVLKWMYIPPLEGGDA